MHIYGHYLQKNGIGEPLGNADVDMELGEEEEGRISWEITTDLYTVPCAKTAARGNLIAALCLQSTQHHAQARRSAL